MVLDDWLTGDQLLALAQHNLSETAFLVERDRGVYGLRWFTPAAEVPLCGHATLAAAHVLRRELGVDVPRLQFETLHSGRLTASERERALRSICQRWPLSRTELSPRLPQPSTWRC